MIRILLAEGTSPAQMYLLVCPARVQFCSNFLPEGDFPGPGFSGSCRRIIKPRRTLGKSYMKFRKENFGDSHWSFPNQCWADGAGGSVTRPCLFSHMVLLPCYLLRPLKQQEPGLTVSPCSACHRGLHTSRYPIAVLLDNGSAS